MSSSDDDINNSSGGGSGQEAVGGGGGVSDKVQQMSSQWAEIIGQLVDRLTGKETSITYAFDDLTIDVPRAQGPNGQNLGSAKWTINGRVVITAEAHEAATAEGRGEMEDRQRSLATSSSA
ncbi:MAG TPA: hypothetical protein VHA09_01655 [Nitrososphaera sp.]|nr:hypothetical protein [Nitrososphaera sp.]